MNGTRTVPIAALAVIALVLSCAKPAPQHTFLDFFIGAVEVIGGAGAPRPAEIKMPLSREDTVKTGAKSMAFVQCGADNIIQVRENAELRLAALPARMDSARAATSLRLLKGSAAFFAESLKEGGSFEVKVAGATCAVRGTLFSAGLAGGSATVMVKEGSVRLTSDTGGFAETTLEAGKKAEIAGGVVKVLPMSADDAKTFSDIGKVRPMAGINCMPPEYIERYFNWRLDIVVPVTPGGDRPGEKAEKDRPGEQRPEDNKKAPSSSAGTRLLVNPLSANGVEASEAAAITGRILGALSAVKGADRVVSRSGSDWRSANRLLTGRVSKLGSTRVISMSVAHGQSGAVLYSKTITSREGDDLDGQIQGAAREMAERTAIWE
jgi:hypothetical protein